MKAEVIPVMRKPKNFQSSLSEQKLLDVIMSWWMSLMSLAFCPMSAKMKSLRSRVSLLPWSRHGKCSECIRPGEELGMSSWEITCQGLFHLMVDVEHFVSPRPWPRELGQLQSQTFMVTASKEKETFLV